MNEQYKRNCPECSKEIQYTTKGHKNRAEIQNTKCKSCAKSEKFLSEETRQKLSESKKGKKRKPFTDKTRKRMRLSRLKYIKNTKGQVIPNSNPKATQIIRAKAKELGITDLQDAETPGGEFRVNGYFVDGRSKEKNIVIEYYEKAHERTKERDERRKKEIIKELGCKFIVIKEYKG